MAHSAVPLCGRCSAEYIPSRGGWSHGRAVQPHHTGLRPGARPGDPLHDRCYQAIYQTMRSAGKKRKRSVDDSVGAQPAATVADDAAPPILCPKGCANSAADEQAAAELLATQFNAKQQQPIATLHASAPARDVTVAHIPKTKVGSADAGDSTVRARSALVEQVIEAVSVPATKQHSDAAKPDLDAQRQSLVKRELPAYTAAVDTANGGWRLGPFTVAELLELKKFTGYVTSPNLLCRVTLISWRIARWRGGLVCWLLTVVLRWVGSATWLLLRKLKTFFDQKGSPLLSVGEQKLRAHMKDDAALYETGGDCGNDVVYVRCTNVKQQLLAALAAHRDSGQLHQYGMVSGSELRCTVLGDKGGAYTKLLLSVWDVVDSQSPKNCLLLGMYRGDESYGVIRDVFGLVFEQLAALTSETALNVLPSAVPSSTPPTHTRRATAALRRERSTLRGDPSEEQPPLRIDCDYLSADCMRCRRLLRAGVAQTPRTCLPYQTVQLTYGGDMQFLSKLLASADRAAVTFAPAVWCRRQRSRRAVLTLFCHCHGTAHATVRSRSSNRHCAAWPKPLLTTSNAVANWTPPSITTTNSTLH